MIIVKFRKKGQTPKFQNIKCLKDTMIRNSVKVPPPQKKKKKINSKFLVILFFLCKTLKKYRQELKIIIEILTWKEARC